MTRTRKPPARLDPGRGRGERGGRGVARRAVHARPAGGWGVCLDILPKASKSVRLYKGINQYMRGINQYM
jgi:hypothetical protein